MPSTDGLELLVRKEQLTDEDWRGLLEARLQLIRPFLDLFTLPKLENLECRDIAGLNRRLGEIAVCTGNVRFSTETQGIFGVISKEALPGTGYQGYSGLSEQYAPCPNGIIKIWGLTRDDFWLLVTVEYVGTFGWKGRGQEIPRTAEFEKVELSTLLAAGADARNIWQSIGQMVHVWVRRSHNLRTRVLRLEGTIAAEEQLTRLISNKK